MDFFFGCVWIHGNDFRDELLTVKEEFYFRVMISNFLLTIKYDFLLIMNEWGCGGV